MLVPCLRCLKCLEMAVAEKLQTIHSKKIAEIITPGVIIPKKGEKMTGFQV